MNLTSKLSLVILFSIVIPAMAFANGHLKMSHSCIKASLPRSKMTGGFITIANKGMHDDHLIAAYSDIAKKTELHTMVRDDGVMRMRAMEGGWAIPAGETLELAPGGNHIMFIDLTAALAAGDMQTITIEFKHAGKIEQMFMVQKADADKMQHGHGMNTIDSNESMSHSGNH